MNTRPAASGKPQKKKPKNPTWEHPKGSGIRIAEMPNKTGGQVFGVSYQVRIPVELAGKREMLQRQTRNEAERLAEDRFLALKKHGTEFSKMPGHAQKEAAIAWSKLDEHNKAKHLNLNFIAVIEAGMKVLSPTGGLRTFAQVAAEMRASKAARKEAGGLDIATERTFRKRSEKLEQTALGDKLVSELTAADLTTALDSLVKENGKKGYSARSVLNYRNILAEILKHAKAKQYTPNNPLDQFTQEDFKRYGGNAAERDVDGINILTVQEARNLLNAALKANECGLLATLVLRLFCGVRTTEVSKLHWSEVHWLHAEPYIHIPAHIAKKRSNRDVEIPENALAWLKLCNPPSAGRIDPLSHKTYAKRIGRVVSAATIKWDINDTRHSFGSYHYALHGDSIYTARQMGHKQGDDELFAHYRQLVKTGEAAEYFGILPPHDAGNVMPFPQAVAN